jgi:predicted transcriptional regulator
MKSKTLTIRLDSDLERELEEACADTGRSRGELVRDALRRQLSLLRFDRLRAKVLPFAEAAGLLTDDDVFRRVS